MGFSGTSGGGEINEMANVGLGTGLIFRDKTGVTFNLKSLLQGAGITLTNNADDIEIAAAGGVSAPSIMGCSYDTDATAGLDFYSICGGLQAGGNEVDRQFPIPVAVVFANLTIDLSVSGGTTTRFRANGINQNQVITTSFVGVSTDAVNTDSEIAGALINISVNEDSGSTIIDGASIECT